MNILKPICFALVLFLFACKSEKTAMTEEETAPEITNKAVELAYFEPSTQFPDATINGFSFKGGKFMFDLQEGDYKLGEQTPDASSKMCANSAEGQHIHVLIDDKPYTAHYKPQFDYTIEDGEHTLLAFLSRSYHESIKTDKANVAKKITVKNGSITESTDIETPMIWHSRPKGTYVGKDTENVMLDFYLKNVTLDPATKVQVVIDDSTTHIINTWQPYYLKGLEMGDHTIELSVVNSEGSPVDGVNTARGTFTLKTDTIPTN